jgi:ABC-type phosphate/phosphonate transport system substrate-binding protein
MIAALPMYDLPWLRDANDRLWAGIAAHLRDAGVDRVPNTLTRSGELDDIWQSPQLLLAQSCGYPLVGQLRETVQLVATPHYRAEGCSEAWHRAAIVVRADHPAQRLSDLRGLTAGMNGVRSNTGMNLFRAAIAPIAGEGAFFNRVIVTGSHARSLAALLSNRIDVASIDAVTLAHLRGHYPRPAEAVRVLAWTDATPGLPLITAAATPPDVVTALRSALFATLTDPKLADALGALLIGDFEVLQLDEYLPVHALEQQAIDQSYPTLQ